MLSLFSFALLTNKKCLKEFAVRATWTRLFLSKCQNSKSNSFSLFNRPSKGALQWKCISDRIFIGFSGKFRRIKNVSRRTVVNWTKLDSRLEKRFDTFYGAIIIHPGRISLIPWGSWVRAIAMRDDWKKFAFPLESGYLGGSREARWRSTKLPLRQYIVLSLRKKQQMKEFNSKLNWWIICKL